MKQLLIWIGLCLLLYGGLGVTMHLYLSANPQKFVIALDTSVYMKERQQQISQELVRLAGRRYSVFSMIVDKGRLLHSWQSRPDTREKIIYYGDRLLSGFTDPSKYSELAQADRILLVSNAEDISELEKIYGNRFTRIAP